MLRYEQDSHYVNGQNSLTMVLVCTPCF